MGLSEARPWRVGVILDEITSVRDLDTLVRNMPVLAITTPERKDAADRLRAVAGEMHGADPAFTLFKAGGEENETAIFRGILGTLLEHHPHAACLTVFGLTDSPLLQGILESEHFQPARGFGFGGISFRRCVEDLEGVPDITLDARNWRNADDVYESFFQAVGAPTWRGRNFDALYDSIVSGGISQIELPYRIIIRHYSDQGSEDVAMGSPFVGFVRELEERGCPVAVVLA